MQQYIFLFILNKKSTESSQKKKGEHFFEKIIKHVLLSKSILPKTEKNNSTKKYVICLSGNKQ